MSVTVLAESVACAELDAVIAEKVMGWTKHEGSRSWLLPTGKLSGWDTESASWDECDHTVWSPSTDIAAAWLIVEKLNLTLINLEEDGWMVGSGIDYVADDIGVVDGRLLNHVTAPTAPLAICLSALKAIE